LAQESKGQEMGLRLEALKPSQQMEQVVVILERSTENREMKKTLDQFLKNGI
jgi:hypothetical protein